MGRGKKTRKAKLAAKAKQRKAIRKKMGKPIYLTLICCPRPIHRLINKFIYKATIHRTSYKQAIIQNVRWQASSLTYCTFSDSHCVGVDFLNSNLKNTSFKNAILEDVVFFNCNLKDANFTGVKFRRVVFITTNTTVAKNLVLNENEKCYVYRMYPKLQLDSRTEHFLLQLSSIPALYNYGILFVNKNKLNKWILQFFIDIYGYDSLKALVALKGKRNKRFLYSIHSYMLHIERYLKL